MSCDHATLSEYAADIAYQRFRLWQLIHKLKQRHHRSDDMDFTTFDQALTASANIADLSHKIQAGIPAAVAAEVAKKEAADQQTLNDKVAALNTTLTDAATTLTAVVSTLPAPPPAAPAQ